MARIGLWIGLVSLSLTTGCVERRFLIESNPPGAKTYVNGQPIGFTPVYYPYLYYGTYDITLEKDGFQTETFRQEVSPPWYAYPPIDFVAEHLNPFKISDNRRFSFPLKPYQPPAISDLMENAQQLRERGRQLPEPENPLPTRNIPPLAPTPQNIPTKNRSDLP